MKLEIEQSALLKMVIKQVDNLFFIEDEEKKTISVLLSDVLERCEYCFSFSVNKYYRKDGDVYFNPFHSGQYSIFLYFLSNSIFKRFEHSGTLSSRIYYLNKCLNGLDLFYEVDMPKVFMLDHPVGSVMGRAQYGEFFAFSQNCTVGNNKGIYPVIGKNVGMLSGSKILGKCEIGDNVIISANTYIKDQSVAPYSLVFGSSPDLVIKERSRK